ncbi:MAG TPA: nucleotidyltransferase domain-containing protein [Longimicrobium sp.]|nr:nucleotidyltransferase domain-containing protein [Longimicrobium sp.]
MNPATWHGNVAALRIKVNAPKFRATNRRGKMTAAGQLLPSSIAPPRARIRSPKRTDPLSATLASGALARVVIDFAVHPEDAPHGREIQRRTGLTPRSLQTELARLERLGVVRRRAEGRLVRYELIEANPRWRALRTLIRELADPVDVVRNALADVPGIAAAFVFGSFARGDTRDDSDVDVFIVDDAVPERLLARRTIDAEILLGREVNVVQMTRDELTRRIASGSSFIRNVFRGRKLWLVGSETDIRSEVEATR